MKNDCNRLKNDRDFKRVYGRGRSYVSPVLVTYCLRKKYGAVRVGITTGKKIGCAVERNRCRRIIREAYRSLAGDIRGSYDIVFVARARTAKMKTQDIRGAMRIHLKKAGMIAENEDV